MDRRTFNTSVGLLACLPITGISKKKVGDVKHITIASEYYLNMLPGNLEPPRYNHTVEIQYEDHKEYYSVSLLIYQYSKFLSKNRGLNIRTREIIKLGKTLKWDSPRVYQYNNKPHPDVLSIKSHDGYQTLHANIIKRIS